MPQTMQQCREQEYREMESRRIDGECMNELHDTPEEVELPPLNLSKVNGEYSRRSVIEVRERQLKSSLAANREQKAEIERLKAELNRYPADWWQDSSLKTWFPFTAEELDRLKAELASLRASVGEKPEDAYERGQLEMRTRMNNTLMTHGSSIVGIELLKYAPPTLPGEEK